MATSPVSWIDFVLAFAQGVTEIFPVSSSAHLVVFSNALDRPIGFGLILFLHLGSFLAILVWFRKDAADLIRGKLGQKILVHLFAALITTAIVGLLFRGLAENLIANQIELIPYLWLVNGSVMLALGIFSPQGDRRIENLRLQDFLLIGLVQGLTVLPGISRLGLTLGIGLLIGLIWIDALKLSFLLSLPTIFLANLYQIVFETGRLSLASVLVVPPSGINLPIPAALSLVVTFVSSLFALQILSSHLSRKLLAYFGLYCISAGLFFNLFFKL